MKQITLNLYEFSELDKEIQNKIVERERWNVMDHMMECYNQDYESTLKEFDKLMETECTYCGVDYHDYHYRFSVENKVAFDNPNNFDNDCCLAYLSGKYLFRYIDNNIIPFITESKVYFGKNNKKRRSRIFKYVGDNCPLTGMCYDFHILEPLLEYYNNWEKYSKHYTYRDLIDSCYESFFSSWHDEYEYWATDDNAILEDLENNDCNLYYENGEVCDINLSLI